jgi:uncharacterized protein
MENFVIDTNFFFNFEVKTDLGNNTSELIANFVNLARKAKEKKKTDFFMPPSVLDEFFTFIPKEDKLAKLLLSVVTIKSPQVDKLSFPAAVFYKLVAQSRERSYKGLKIAEELVDASGQKMLTASDLSKIEYQKQIGEIITRLRDRYRNATRVKFLDSTADLDIIVLAKEINGTIITSDEGLLLWARTFGVAEVIPEMVKQRLTDF